MPRFFQGDSLSYLATGTGWIPPDRSWAFGFVVNFLLRYTHVYSAFILFQIGVFFCLIAAARILFSESGGPTVVYGAIAVLLALDPFLEMYTRFFLTDFLAMAAFLAALIALCVVCRGRDSKRLWVATFFVVAATVVAIFLRIAYVPIIEVTVLLLAMIMWGRLALRQWFALAITALGPCLAIGTLVAANWFVFADRYPGELFVNRLSGVLLAGVFAPALQPADFDNVGIPITVAEFQRMELTDYNRRPLQIWGNTPDYLHQFLKNTYGITSGYAAVVDKAARDLFWSALMRDPAAVAEVYVRNALLYAQPSEWRRKFDWETGISSPLPQSFVEYSNRYSAKIDYRITTIRSPLIQAYAAVCSLYPFQLLLGLLSAAYLALRERRVAAAVLSAALIAVLAAAPLYSPEMAARYVIGGIVVSYLLIGLAIQSIVTRMRHPSTTTPLGIGI